MSTKTTPAASAAPDLDHWEPVPGAVFHTIDSGAPSISDGSGFAPIQPVRGMSITITEAMLDASRDRYGETWLTAIADPTEQSRRWGWPRFAPGPAPEGMEPWVHGDALWAEQREQARRDAHALPTAEARRDALAAVEARFGAALPTSRTTNAWQPGNHPTETMAADQERRFAAGRRDRTR